ncbi:alpha/beta fold hydrolase [Parendozoicomonas haliclonae]|uniref:Lipase 3 n=1 Tax=Parendozoicomonas haliclonae TaxID=1960125 RepID=A0A1X7AJB6_9GAMM|nr:alpha/beta fold hydrolase [Parendozoicomonas haliclonae]SMA45625.1 Lipase 3 precursor [Parendozoicomonas haliclonae]
MSSHQPSRLQAALWKMQDGFYNAAIKMERSRAGLQLEQISVGNINFSLLRGGKPGAETILMVHGFGADKDNWIHLAGQLGDQYQILAVDLAGHGESSQESDNQGNPLNFEIPAQADRIKALLDQLGIAKVHFIGNSMGGAIGLQFAASHQDALHTLMLVDNAGIESPVQSEFFQLLEKGENPLIAREKGDYEVLMSFVMSKRPFMPWPVPAVLERKAIARAALNDTIFADMLKSRDEMGNPEQIEAILAAITVPSLVIWGEEDRVLDISSIEVMAKYMPNLKSVTLPGIGHVPMLEAPKKVATAFRQFAGSV